MNQYNEDKLQTFIDDVKVTLNGFGNDGIIRYLLSGMADGFSYGGDLSSDLFFHHFYVPVEQLIEQHRKLDILSANKAGNLKSDYIGDTLRKFEKTHSLYTLQGPAGSGKSTLVNYLVYTVNRKSNNHFELIHIDCALDRGMYDAEIHFPVNKFVEKYKDADKAMRKDPEWENHFSTILYRLNHTYLELNNGFLRYFFSNIRRSSTFSSNDCLQWVVSLQDKKLNLYERSSLLAFLLILYLSKMEDKKKYVFFMDNLEMYIYRSDQPVQSIKTSLRDIDSLFIKLSANSAFKEFFTVNSFVNTFVFVLCLRTATRITEEKTLYIGDAVHDGEFIIENLDIPSYDFSVRAIHKKLKFLKQHLPEELGTVTSFIDPLYKISPEKKIDKDSLAFSQRYYIPFNNYNYRIAIRNLESVSKYREEIGVLNDFLKKIPQKKEFLKNFAINGNRMLVYRSRYEHLQQNGFMEALGITNVKATHFPSNTRHILSFIFFYERLNGQKVSFNELNRLVCLTNYADSGFKSIAEAVSIFGPTSTSLIKEESLRRWGALVEISGIHDIHELQRELETMENTENVSVYLTPAGEDYVINESKQFEYFVSRIIDNDSPRYKPLFSYLSIDTVENAIAVIKDVLSQVRNAVRSLEWHPECLRTCDIKNCPKVFSQRPRVCTRIIKSYEMFAVIKMYMDYIDRYRVVLVTKLCWELSDRSSPDNNLSADAIIKINNKLLGLLEQYNACYDSIEQILSNVMTQEKHSDGHELNLYEYILQITQAVIEVTHYRIIYPQYYWRIFGETVKTGYYPYKTMNGGFSRIISMAQITEINDQTTVFPLAKIMSRAVGKHDL